MGDVLNITIFAVNILLFLALSGLIHFSPLYDMSGGFILLAAYLYHLYIFWFKCAIEAVKLLFRLSSGLTLANLITVILAIVAHAIFSAALLWLNIILFKKTSPLLNAWVAMIIDLGFIYLVFQYLPMARLIWI